MGAATAVAGTTGPLERSPATLALPRPATGRHTTRTPLATLPGAPSGRGLPAGRAGGRTGSHNLHPPGSVEGYIQNSHGAIRINRTVNVLPAAATPYRAALPRLSATGALS
jgi:hypothetical protein